MNTQQQDQEKQAIIAAILEKAPSNVAVEVDLPSESRVYRLEDPGSPITIRPMTYEDERAMVSQSSDDPMNIVLSRCVGNVKVHDLLLMDKMFLIMKLREISFGDDYEVLLICPDCGEENPATIKLSQLPINPVPDDFVDPVTISLKGIDKECKVRLPRVRDTKHLSGEEGYFNDLWRFVESIDGHTDKSIIHPVVEGLPVMDRRAIVNAMLVDYGIETKAKLDCKKCGGVNVVELPIGTGFFGVN